MIQPLPRLIHHSADRLENIRSVEQIPTGDFVGTAEWGKPQGLWVATDSGWADYCMSINRPLGQHHYELVLSPEARILRLSSAADIDAFTVTYGKGNPLEGFLNQHMTDHPMTGRQHVACDWQAVARRYHGMIIHPHIRARHNHQVAFWYYTWDVASGCIWDADAVQEIRLLNQEVIE